MRTNSSDSATAKRLVSLSEDSSSEEESSDDSDYESSEDEADKSPLPTVRPTGAIESVKYDCIKALWRPRNRPASSDDIRDGLKHFWELFQTIRDRWKSDSADVKQAEDSKKNHEIPLLKERVAKQREMAEFSLRAAMDYGHPDIIEQYVPLFFPSSIFLCVSWSHVDEPTLAIFLKFGQLVALCIASCTVSQIEQRASTSSAITKGSP